MREDKSLHPSNVGGQYQSLRRSVSWIILGRNARRDDAEDFGLCEEGVDSISYVAEASSARGIVRLQEFR